MTFGDAILIMAAFVVGLAIPFGVWLWRNS